MHENNLNNFITSIMYTCLVIYIFTEMFQKRFAMNEPTLIV